MHTLRRTLAGTAVLSMLAGLPLSALGSPTEADQAPFGRVSTYPVYLNVPAGTDRNAQTNAEISTVSQDGNTLIYTDAAGKRIGFLDISDPSAPRGLGSFDLAKEGDADDQPTSVAACGDYLLVVVDQTGKNYDSPSGRVDVVRIADREKVASIDLKGQPDSIAISPDGKYAAIAIENQRDEDRGDGGLPQLPAGFVQTIELNSNPSSWKATPVYFVDKKEIPTPKSPLRAGIALPTLNPNMSASMRPTSWQSLSRKIMEWRSSIYLLSRSPPRSRPARSTSKVST